MKKTITTIFTGLGLLAIALAIYFKPLHSKSQSCKPSCMSQCEKKRDLTFPQQETEVNNMLTHFNFVFNLDSLSREQVYFISQKKNKNFVVLMKVLNSTQDGKIKSMRFTLINSEGNYYEISHITQPIILQTNSGEGRKIKIDLCFEQQKCDLPYIPKWYDYLIKDPKHYVEKGDVVVHSENKAHFSKDTIQSPIGIKAFEIGEHICQVKFQ